MGERTPLVSVIVPNRNGAKWIPGLIESLAAQTLSRDQFEVIIGDDGSTDASVVGIETADGWLRVVGGPPSSSYTARNRAVHESRGAVLAFCDADCRPEPEWLEAGLTALEHTDAVAGLIRFILPQQQTAWTLLDIESTKDHERQVRVGNAETANLFVRRELYDRLDGFDDSVPEMGDFDFAKRLVATGARLSFEPDVVVWHPTRDRPRPILHMLWIMNRWYGARAARTGEWPVGVKLRCLVPLVSVARGRRRYGVPVRLDRPRLAANGIDPSLREEIAALALIYFLVPYLRFFAQLRGWLAERLTPQLSG
jgi:glycosyltransferase involved in cell wall biosynthesis